MSMRRIICIIVLVMGALGFRAESIPDGYYSDIEGLKDSILKTALHNIISVSEHYAYGTFGYTYPEGVWYPGTWVGFPYTDQRADSTVWDMYSPKKRYFPIENGSACAMNIEHCFPSSWWAEDDNMPYTDLFHLNPADGQANTRKNDYPPGVIDGKPAYDNGIFKVGKNSAYGTFNIFEPADIYKGDFARTYFYMVTCYEDLTWNAEKNQCPLTNTSYLEFDPWLIEVLLSWHRADAVSDKEIRRADAVSTIQHNRNPYIDYPELVEYIWGNKKGQAVSLQDIVCTADSTYVPKEDFTNFMAYAPKDASENGFTARWKDYETSYTLNVYTKTTTGHNDTLVNFPAISQKLINSDTSGHITFSGKLNTYGAGTSATTMGASDTDGAIILQNMAIPQGARLVFRASFCQTATEAVLAISLDDEKWQDIALTADEQWYTLVLPREAKKVTIASVGGATTKRAAMQALFLITGDETTTCTSLPGYPKEMNAHSEYVSLPGNDNYTCFYKVFPQGYQASNEVCVNYSKASSVQDVSMRQPAVRKVLINGQLYLEKDNCLYTVTGQQIAR